MKVVLTAEQHAAMRELARLRSSIEAQFLKLQEHYRYAVQMWESHSRERLAELKSELGIADDAPATFHWTDFSFDVEEADGGNSDNTGAI